MCHCGSGIGGGLLGVIHCAARGGERYGNCTRESPTRPTSRHLQRRPDGGLTRGYGRTTVPVVSHRGRCRRQAPREGSTVGALPRRPCWWAARYERRGWDALRDWEYVEEGVGPCGACQTLQTNVARSLDRTDI